MKAELDTKLILDLAFLEEFNEDFHQWKKKKGRKGEGREEKKKNQVLPQKGKWGRVLSVSIPQYLGYLESMKKCLTGHRQVPEEPEMVVAPDMNH